MKREVRDVSVVQVLGNQRVWHLACIGFAQAVGLYTMSFWLPLEVKSLSSLYTNTVVGFLVTIPNLVGLVAMIIVSRHSDHTRERRFHIAIPLAIAGSAFLSLSGTHSPVLSMLLLSLVALGAFSFFGPFFASISAFLSGASAATGIALVTAVANLGGFAGPYLVGTITRRTGTLSGGVALAGASLLVSATLALFLPKPTLAA